jgi:hypothetical protein
MRPIKRPVSSMVSASRINSAGQLACLTPPATSASMASAICKILTFHSSSWSTEKPRKLGRTKANFSSLSLLCLGSTFLLDYRVLMCYHASGFPLRPTNARHDARRPIRTLTPHSPAALSRRTLRKSAYTWRLRPRSNRHFKRCFRAASPPAGHFLIDTSRN